MKFVLAKCDPNHDWQTIRARLVELEAENERLRERSTKAEALLRDWLSGKWCTPEYDAARQRAYDHLSENGHG